MTTTLDGNPVTTTPAEAADRLTRRHLLRVFGASAIAGAAMMATGGKVFADPSAPSDTEIFNFALNLEYLEAEFYSYATTGKGLDGNNIPTSGTGTYGPTTGGSKVDFQGDTLLEDVANQIAQDERDHVLILRDLLASDAVAKPAINLNALGIGFAGPAQFLTLARAFEDTGVSAYGGAAPLISSSANVGYAAQILAVEAYHASNIRLQIAQAGITTTPIDQLDIIPPPSGTRYFTTTGSLSVIRTTGEVLAIVYAAHNATKGGFFPNGVNGVIHTSS